MGTKINELELLYVRFFGEFRVISQFWEAIAAKQLKIATEL